MMMPGDRLQPAPPAKFFFAVSCGRPQPAAELQERLVAEFGPLDLPGQVYRFSDFSTYYDAETGGTVWKYLVGIRELRACSDLVPVKLAAERIQWESARPTETGLKRRFNLDPGYVNGWQVVLATVKNHGHRLYLGHGVFGEVTLLYRKGGFQPLPWTYADYRASVVLAELGQLRQDYLRRLRQA